MSKKQDFTGVNDATILRKNSGFAIQRLENIFLRDHLAHSNITAILGEQLDKFQSFTRNLNCVHKNSPSKLPTADTKNKIN